MNFKEIFKVGTLLTLLLATAASAEMFGEWGDAPENAIAYPSLGVIGAFPTCQNTGPAQWIYHGPLGWAWFGPSVDFEMEGNAGFCAQFPPYDQDECFGDNDAGLLIPPAYTIVQQAGGLTVVPCQMAGVLGNVCTNATWGVNVDIFVTNNMPTDGFLNVLMDFDQSGNWGGAAYCGNTPAPEHILVDFPIPMGFSGPVSALMPPGFLIGPNDRFVWTRFSVTEMPVGSGWDGHGMFEDGETEDYLLEILDSTATQDLSWSEVKSSYR